MPGGMQLPDINNSPDMACRFEKQGDRPRYSVYVSGSYIMRKGLYIMQVTATNPENAIQTAGIWTFGTYKQAVSGGYPNNIIDSPARVRTIILTIW
jgi:hypothetical protein